MEVIGRGSSIRKYLKFQLEYSFSIRTFSQAFILIRPTIAHRSVRKLSPGYPISLSIMHFSISSVFCASFFCFWTFSSLRFLLLCLQHFPNVSQQVYKKKLTVLLSHFAPLCHCKSFNEHVTVTVSVTVSVTATITVTATVARTESNPLTRQK